MLQSLTTLLTASAMLLHAVLGCCVHHEHTHGVEPDVAVACSSAAGAHQHAHGHTRSAASSHADCSGRNVPAVAGSGNVREISDGCDSESEPVENCDEAKCQWVGTEVASVVPAAADALGTAFDAGSEAEDVLSQRAAGTPARSFLLPDLSGAGRARARSQVWLL